jgi:hypothetical protein
VTDQDLFHLYPYPATVHAADLLEHRLPPASFDVVTLIGSTLSEIGAYEAALDAAVALLAPGGHLFYMDFVHLHASQRFDAHAAQKGWPIVAHHVVSEHPDAAFYVYVVRLPRGAGTT